MAENENVAVRGYRLVREEGPIRFLVRLAAYAVGLATTLVWMVRYGIDFRPAWRAAMSTEDAIFRDLFANLGPDDVFYDVGADTGLFTLPVASMLGPGRVVAFEPGEGSETLRDRLRDAGAEATVVEKAITGRAGATYHAHEGRVGLLGDTDAPEFPTTDASEILAEGSIPLPTVVKIDVFGAEGDVVEGLEELLARDECRLVYLELHLPMTFQRKRPEPIFDDYMETWSLTDVVEVLFRCGFEVEPIHLRADTDDLFIRASKPRGSGTGVDR